MGEKTKGALAERFGQAARALDEHALVLGQLVEQVEAGDAGNGKVAEIVAELRAGMGEYLRGLDGIDDLVGAPTGFGPAEDRRVLPELHARLGVRDAPGTAPMSYPIKLRIGASRNRLHHVDEHVITREGEFGFTLCALRTLLDELVERVGTDTHYLTTLEVEVSGEEWIGLKQLLGEDAPGRVGALHQALEAFVGRVDGLEKDVLALRRGEAGLGKRVVEAEDSAQASLDGLGYHHVRLLALEEQAHPAVDLTALVRQEILKREREVAPSRRATLRDPSTGEDYTALVGSPDPAPCERMFDLTRHRVLDALGIADKGKSWSWIEAHLREIAEEDEGITKACGALFGVTLAVPGGEPTRFSLFCNFAEGHHGNHGVIAPEQGCTCSMHATAYEGNPRGHFVGCPRWGTDLPHACDKEGGAFLTAKAVR